MNMVTPISFNNFVIRTNLPLFFLTIAYADLLRTLNSARVQNRTAKDVTIGKSRVLLSKIRFCFKTPLKKQSRTKN